jgi:4-carboxymuconolactone decarboxylase
MKENLTTREQSIVTIAAFTAKGDLEQLRKALNSGLGSGLTINEAKEVLVQLYAYCGFPRSPNGITTLMSVLEERAKKGIKDEVGKFASAVPSSGSKYVRGQAVLETLAGRKEAGPKTELAAFSPEIDVFLKLL